MEEANPLIDCRQMGVRFGSFTALSGFDLTLKAGMAIGLVGPNGAGKSTLLKAAVGLEIESEGSIRVLGERPKTASQVWKRQVGALLDNLSLFDALSIEEHFELSGELFGLERAERKRRTAFLLEALGLSEDRSRFAALSSFGMRKKTALGLALLHGPRLLLLDEPFEGLDPASAETVLEILLRAKAKGVGILFSSHTMSAVERLADEAILLERGATAWRGDPKNAEGLHALYLQTIQPTLSVEPDWF